MKISVRPATEADLQAILDLVFELAVYEKAPEAVTATLEDYQKAWKEGIFEAEVAEADASVVGMVLYYTTWSTWKGKMLYLEDFVVKEAYRRFGVGQLLFDAFLATARAKNCVMVKWQVLDWNEPALSFYRKNNAVIEQEWWTGKIFLH